MQDDQRGFSVHELVERADRAIETARVARARAKALLAEARTRLSQGELAGIRLRPSGEGGASPPDGEPQR